MKTKVAIVCLSPGTMGIDIFLANLIGKLDRERFSVDVIVVEDENTKDSPREKELIAQGCRILRTCAPGGIRRILRHSIRLYRLLRAGGYDVCHSNQNMFNGVNMLIAALAGVPVRVCHSHTVRSRLGNSLPLRVYQPVMRLLSWSCSNRRLGCSEAALDYQFGTRWRTPNTHSYVIYNGIALERFSPQGFDAAAASERLGLDGTKRHIIAVGRMTEAKNPFFTLEVMKEVNAITSDVDLLWVGSGELDEAVKRRAAELGLDDTVRFLGVRDDVNDLLRCADVYIMPSLYEGLGIALIEAQAAGLPCVASDVIPREADCGGCVFLPTALGSEKWAQTLLDVLAHPELYPKAHDLQRFDVRCMAKQMEGIYTK